MKDKYNVLLTCIGGYGALNLLEDFMKSSISKSINFIGSHSDPIYIARSPLEKNYLVPSALNNTAEYIRSTKEIIKAESIDLIIPKSDAEVKALYSIKKELGCNTFLPAITEIQNTQDKFDFYNLLKDSDVPVAETYQVNSFEQINVILDKLTKIKGKYWLRVKTAGTAGAYGAQWIENSEDAIDWIKNFSEKNNTSISDFTISEYLPGRLFECLLLYKNGALKLAKIYENLRFANGTDPIKNGVGSTPDFAKSISDSTSTKALANAIKAIDVTTTKLKTVPNGIYHMSAKENSSGDSCITEVNIGRTPSTISIFNRIGDYNVAEYFLNYALDLDIHDPEKIYDIPPDTSYAIRSLDVPLQIIPGSKLKSVIKI